MGSPARPRMPGKSAQPKILCVEDFLKLALVKILDQSISLHG